jgi:hypothetical protein
VDADVVKLDGADAIAGFIAAAKKTRIWDRAPKVRNVRNFRVSAQTRRPRPARWRWRTRTLRIGARHRRR